MPLARVSTCDDLTETATYCTQQELYELYGNEWQCMAMYAVIGGFLDREPMKDTRTIGNLIKVSIANLISPLKKTVASERKILKLCVIYQDQLNLHSGAL